MFPYVRVPCSLGDAHDGDSHPTLEVSKWRESGMVDLRYMSDPIAVVAIHWVAFAEIGAHTSVRCTHVFSA
jgi:hypothetical protein